MDVYLKLPGHAGTSLRKGYRGWLALELLEFERPVLEKESASFTIYRLQDALSRVFKRQLERRLRFTRIRIHHVEGTEAIAKLRFDHVTVSGWSVDPTHFESTERVSFVAGRWQYE